jgi:germination protein YpeB
VKKEISSGAKKAEKLTEKTSKKGQTEKSKQTKNSAVKSETKDFSENNEKATQNKKDGAISRDERKEKAEKARQERRKERLEKKLEHKKMREERILAFREKQAQRKEARRERRDMLKNESKEERIARKAEARALKAETRRARQAERIAERQAKREHALKLKEERRANRRESGRGYGFGGWLAAVISLGVTTLALGTMLTFGWITMDGMQGDMAGVHTQSVYELNSIVDNLNSNLSKARVASSTGDKVRILSDIAIESEMAEEIIERIPVDSTLTQNMTSFVNKMGDSAKSMLYSIADGGELSDSQKATLSYMYERNLQLKEILNELVSNTSEKTMIKALKGNSDSIFYTSFSELENNTIETPKEIHDGPFAENTKRVTAKNIESLKEINATKAEELAKEYFESYDIKEAKCNGEAIAKEIECYNVTLKTDDGEMLVQLSKKGGKVVMFDSYKDCDSKNFSVERCIDIAEDFLKGLGYASMKPVWTSENGTTCNLNFAYENGGVVFYSDMIKLKVCEERGCVTGMEGFAYILNLTVRDAGKATITKAQARE